MAYTFKKFRKQTKKFIPMVRKGVRSVAKAYLGVARSGAVKTYRKTGVVSTTAIAKSLTNLKARVNSVAENKKINELHTTGSPDASLRQFYRVSASSTPSTVSTTSLIGNYGYFLNQITYPTRGDGLTNYDGKKFHVSNINWNGTLYANTSGISARLMIVKYDDEDMDAFQMNELLRVDNNAEYSVNCRRNVDFLKSYKVIASRNYKFSSGNNLRKDFKISCNPSQMIKQHETDDTIFSHRFYCLILISGDIGSQAPTSSLDYQGSTRMTFIA